MLCFLFKVWIRKLVSCFVLLLSCDGKKTRKVTTLKRFLVHKSTSSLPTMSVREQAEVEWVSDEFVEVSFIVVSFPMANTLVQVGGPNGA